MQRFTLAFALALTLGACGGPPAMAPLPAPATPAPAAAPAPAGPTPADLCLGLVARVCERYVDCVVQPPAAGRDAAVTDCVQASGTMYDCARATAVSASYPRCLDDLGAYSCAALTAQGSFAAPASCDGAVTGA